MQRWLYARRALHSRAFIRGYRKQAPAFCGTNNGHSVSTKALSEAPRRVIFSGIQPTGIPHLGNYLGAFRPWAKLQKERELGDELNFSIVDFHALTIPQDPAQLTEWSWDTYVALLAVGLDPKISRIFFQSEVQGHTELMWILSTVASTGYLSRMTQWKSKLNLSENVSFNDRRASLSLKLGLFSYPVLQAADILLYQTTHVPVGEDQQQHIEFARSLAASFNNAYTEVFRIPEPIISPARRIMSLTDPSKKMSKSDVNPNSRILLTDDVKTIHQKFRTALTDSHGGVTYDPKNRPGVSNLLEILHHTTDEEVSVYDLAADFKGSTLRLLKETVANAVVKSLQEVRDKFLRLRSSPEKLHSEIHLNQHQASTSTSQTMGDVRKALGLPHFGKAMGDGLRNSPGAR